MLPRAAALVGRAWQEGTYSTLAPRLGQQFRGMGGSAHGNPNDYVTYAGLTLKKVSGTEYAFSKLLGTAMWFWVFKMTYDNWDHKIHGLAGVFEAEGLDDDDHGHHH